jgi:acyl-CoA synthetase (AMP-forming)/AMP-acid ligase II
MEPLDDRRRFAGGDADLPCGSGWGVMGLYHGAQGVIAREFDPTKVLDFFEQSGITKLFMVPAAMQFVVRQPRARQVDFSRLKYMLYGASPIPAALLKECIEVFKCGFVQMYGMTETTGTIVALPPEDHIDGLDRMRSAGKALPGIELAILDAKVTRCRRAKSARLPPAPAPTWPATGTCRKRPHAPSTRTAGCAPATPATWTRTAISISTIASRT